MKKMKFACLFAALMLMCASVLASCTGGGPGNTASADNILKMPFSEDPDTLDPQKTTEYYMVPLNIFDRLVEAETVAGKPEIVLGLAESYEVSEDGLVYTFKLRDGVKFHNGETLTSDDVVYTVNRMMRPENETLNTDFFDMVKGALAVYEGEADEVEGVIALDSLTVQFTLEYPFGAFLANLATPAGSIFNRKQCEAAGNDFGIEPSQTVGTGPFQVTDWQLNNKLSLTAFKDYWRGAASIDGVEFIVLPDHETQRMSFENGELDVFDAFYAPSQLPYFLESSKWKGNIVSGLEAGLYFYLFNVEAEPYNIPGVREAIAYAIDRQLILDTLFNGEGKVVDCIVVEGVLGHNPGFPKMEYNPQKAKELLAEAGFPDGLACEIIITNDASSSERDMNVAIQGMLKEVGIDLSIRAVDMATYYDMREKGQTPLERMAWWVDYNDPDNFLYTFFSEKKSAHYSVNYFDPEVISLLEAARREVDNDARLKMYQDAEEIIVARDHVAIPMFQVTHTFVLSDRVKNFKVSWNGWSDMPLYEISIQN